MSQPISRLVGRSMGVVGNRTRRGGAAARCAPISRRRSCRSTGACRRSATSPPALGVTRAELRKALAVLESEGQLWRHVGKGTFVGSRPVDTLADIAALARRTNPAEVMARAARASSRRSRGSRPSTRRRRRSPRCAAPSHRSRQASTWRQYESWDKRLHRIDRRGDAERPAARPARHAERRAPRRHLGAAARQPGTRPRPTITASPSTTRSSPPSPTATRRAPPTRCGRICGRSSATCCPRWTATGNRARPCEADPKMK